MVKAAKNSSFSLRSLIFWVACFALLASFSLFVLEKTRITNLYTKPVSPSASAEDVTRPVNDISTSPATESQKSEGERIKQAAAETQSSNQQNNNGKISIALSAAGQDVMGGPLVVRAIINGATSGECKLVVSNTDHTKELTAEIINLGTYYGCKGFNVPVTDLDNGMYKITLTATSNTESGTISQQVEIKK